jgi:hypothetical protein
MSASNSRQQWRRRKVVKIERASLFTAKNESMVKSLMAQARQNEQQQNEKAEPLQSAKVETAGSANADHRHPPPDRQRQRRGQSIS